MIMVKIIKEDFNDSTPARLKTILLKNKGLKARLLNQGVDFANATWNKVSNIADVADGITIFIVDDNNHDFAISKNGSVIFGTSAYINGRNCDLNKKSVKWLIANCKEAYSTTDTKKDDIHADSRDALANAGDFKRQNGQYYSDYYGTWSSQGSTKKGVLRGNEFVDKSGYIVDPEKYIKKLYSINMDNYAEQIERIYNKAKKAQSMVREIEENRLGDPSTVLNRNYSYNDEDSYPNKLSRSDARSAHSYLDSLIRNYELIIERIQAGLSDRVKEYGGLNNDYTESMIQSNVKDFNRAYQKILDMYNKFV